jgi:gamma-glutamyltranspeptidase / glutathione hydrolase
MTGRMKLDLFAWPEVLEDRNVHGPLSFAIPSAVAGYAELHRRHGKLPLSVVLAPAVALAKRGLSQDWFTTLKVANSAAVLRLYAESARIYLPNGLPPVPPYQGEPGFFRQGKLAETLERLAHAGLRDFYEGEVAGELLADFREMGSPINAADLPAARRIARPALEAEWRGKRLFLANGLTAGADAAARAGRDARMRISRAQRRPPPGTRSSPASCARPMRSASRASATPSPRRPNPAPRT